MNCVQLLGNLARDVNLHDNGNTPFCNLTVAVSDGYGEKEYTSFISVKVFGRTAENCAKYLTKGSKVAVTGRIQTGSYEKQDGTKVYTTDVIAREVEFLSKSSQQEVSDAPDEDVPEGFESVDEDIPF